MRSLVDMDTIQIEITNACIHSCSNCTRFCGHRTPYFMDWEFFKDAVDSMAEYYKMTGIMGGEPLLHPDFERFCDYALSKIPRKQLGLWTCLPPGYEKHREVICRTFGNIFINDHSRGDIYHAPILVAAEEIFGPNKQDMFLVIDKCWVQNCWSAAINPTGAYFCEIAAALNLLMGDKGLGWKVEPGWWKRTPKDFREQIEEFCPKCGCALPLPRRASVEGIDDVSPGMLERLKDRSKKLQAGKYAVSDLQFTKNPQRMAAYKDQIYRNNIALKYGICLTLNQDGFNEPHLLNNYKPGEPKRTVFDEIQEAYGG